MNSFKSKSLTDTAEIATKWLEQISEEYADSDEALVVGLSGHLGAGKTAFVKLIAEQMGVNEAVTSPTFVLMKIYETKNERWPRLIHIDAYRLEKREELQALNWESLVADPHNLILVEWPEKVGLNEFGPKADLQFEIKDDKHTITYK